MRKKDIYLKQRADKKLIIRHYLFKAMIVLMLAIVLYDSFKHQTPFYYICFLFLGMFIGKVFSLANRVTHLNESETFTIISSTVGSLITLLLLSIRFIWGRYILEVANVSWTTDALYLLFIGIYWSQLKSMVDQVDEIIYGWMKAKEDSSNSD